MLFCFEVYIFEAINFFERKKNQKMTTDRLHESQFYWRRLFVSLGHPILKKMIAPIIENMEFSTQVDLRIDKATKIPPH